MRLAAVVLALEQSRRKQRADGDKDAHKTRYQG
jgi:hypothetical protein